MSKLYDIYQMPQGDYGVKIEMPNVCSDGFETPEKAIEWAEKRILEEFAELYEHYMAFENVLSKCPYANEYYHSNP